MPGSDGLRIYGFKKKTVSWDSTLEEGWRFLIWAWPDQFGSTGCLRWLSQWVESWQSTNSQHSKKLCLSLLLSGNLKLKKVNESFVPGPKESRQCFGFFWFLCLWTLRTLYVYVHYSYTYLGCIFGLGYATLFLVNVSLFLSLMLCKFCVSKQNKKYISSFLIDTNRQKVEQTSNDKTSMHILYTGNVSFKVESLFDLLGLGLMAYQPFINQFI